jgi:hypothetical protein
MDSPLAVLNAARQTYGTLPSSKEIRKYRKRLNSFLEGNYILKLGQVNGFSTDPLEEVDDNILWKDGLSKVEGLNYVLISNGKHNCQARFDYIRSVLPMYASANWDIPFRTEKGTLVFLQDGSEFPYPLDVFVNAGPMSKKTTKSIKMKDKSLVLTVGANDDFTAAGINQIATDGGKEAWNEWIQTVPTKKNLSVMLSRYVLFPKMDDYMETMVTTASMFIACRPPPECLRINEGNSIIASQLIENSQISWSGEGLESGLETLQEYMDWTISKGLPASHYEAAALPIVVTNLLGGRYPKGGPYGFNPADSMAKQNVACLLPETVQTFQDNIRQFKYFTPAYDPVALIMAVHEYAKL